MICPYLKKVIHKPEEFLGTHTIHYAEDITGFCECVGHECPFYYTTEEHNPSYMIKDHCQRAESEVIKHE